MVLLVFPRANQQVLAEAAVRTSATMQGHFNVQTPLEAWNIVLCILGSIDCAMPQWEN